jgi:hypothetical protein
MSRVRIRIDDELLFDDDLDVWQATPPDAFRDMLRPGAQPQPWMKAIMVTMADAAMAGDSVSIEAITGPAIWSMEVTKT